MTASINMIFERLISEVPDTHHRYLYHDFSLSNRLIGLVGARGVGKTTMMLQYIKNVLWKKEKVFYFSADHIYFNTTTLYEYVERMYLNDGITIFFIDEIHRYKNWNQELKNLYDGFPSMKIVFSGSSSLDIIKGAYDLSRRAKMYYLPGLSFREYLNFVANTKLEVQKFENLVQNPRDISAKISTTPSLIKHFHAYLQQGYYPFVDDDPLSYYEKILAVIEKTIYKDIANFYQLKTENLNHFKKILNYLAMIPPGKVSTYNIGKNLKISDKTANHYLKVLDETGLVRIIYSADTGNASLRKPEKVFLNNTNLQYALGGHLGNQIEIGTVRELAFVQSLKNGGFDVFYSKQGDFEVNNLIFEIGGKNKTRKQIKGLKNAILVQDDIVSATVGSIPLCYFGLMY